MLCIEQPVNLPGAGENYHSPFSSIYLLMISVSVAWRHDDANEQAKLADQGAIDVRLTI
jgi:hypothetical protein